MNSNNKIIAILWNLYKDDLQEEVRTHWKNIVGPEDEEDFYKWQSNQIPWFGNLEAWASEIFGSKEVPAVFEKFPPSIKGHVSKTAAEMNFLFPQKELTTAFLPIILTGYCVKRKRPYLKKSSEEGSSKGKPTKSPQEEPSKELIDILFGRNPETTKETVRYSLIEKYLTHPELHQKYKKMTSSCIKYENTDRTLAMYLRPVLFLFFLTKVSDKCNVSWSFYVFEHMTKSLHLLGSDAEALLEKLSEEDSFDGNVMQYDPLRNEILELAESIINDALKAPKDGTSERFLIFLTRAKAEFAKMEQSPIAYDCGDFGYWIQGIDESLSEPISLQGKRRSKQLGIAEYMKVQNEYDVLLERIKFKLTNESDIEAANTKLKIWFGDPDDLSKFFGNAADDATATDDVKQSDDFICYYNSLTPEDKTELNTMMDSLQQLVSEMEKIKKNHQL